MKISIRSIDVGFDPRQICNKVILSGDVSSVEYDGPDGGKTATGDIKKIALELAQAGYEIKIEKQP